jgi:hypothetical protein
VEGEREREKEMVRQEDRETGGKLEYAVVSWPSSTLNRSLAITLITCIMASERGREREINVPRGITLRTRLKYRSLFWNLDCNSDFRVDASATQIESNSSLFSAVIDLREHMLLSTSHVSFKSRCNSVQPNEKAKQREENVDQAELGARKETAQQLHVFLLENYSVPDRKKKSFQSKHKTSTK